MTNLAKARLGFLTAQLIGLTLAGVAACHLSPFVQRHLAAVCAVLACFGLIEAFMRRGRQSAAERPPKGNDAAAETDSANHPFAPVFSLSSTGLVTIMAAAAIYVFVSALNRPPQQPPLVAASESAPPKTNSPAPVVFPPLDLDGLAYSGEHPTAIIQGCTVGIGDYVEGVRVVAIGKEGVTVELEGEQAVLRLGHPPSGETPQNTAR